jgi:hypothetical protein
LEKNISDVLISDRAPKVSQDSKTGHAKQNVNCLINNWVQRFTSIILATWEAEIGRITAQGQPRKIVPKTPISKITREK